MDILQQRVTQQVVVCGIPDDGRDGCQPRLLRGSPAPLPHHQLIASAGRDFADHDWLHQSEFADRVDELGKGLLVEHLPRLTRVGLDERGVDLAVHRTHVHALDRRPTDHDIGRRFAQARSPVGRTGGDQ